MRFNMIFENIFTSETTQVMALPSFLLCICAAAFVGFFVALTYTYKTKYTKSFVCTLAILPTVVAMVILMVNGNLGAGVAVAGAFSLVRFRSVPGTAKEIGAIFLAMGGGLAMGMGYLAYGVLFTVIVSALSLFYGMSPLGRPRKNQGTLRITIPESLDYMGVFDDLFQKYTSDTVLVHVKTSNMGSMFKLMYEITLNDRKDEKKFIDDLRCRNGNLEVSLSRGSDAEGGL